MIDEERVISEYFEQLVGEVIEPLKKRFPELTFEADPKLDERVMVRGGYRIFDPNHPLSKQRTWRCVYFLPHVKKNVISMWWQGAGGSSTKFYYEHVLEDPTLKEQLAKALFHTILAFKRERVERKKDDVKRQSKSPPKKPRRGKGRRDR